MAKTKTSTFTPIHTSKSKTVGGNSYGSITSIKVGKPLDSKMGSSLKKNTSKPPKSLA